MAERTSRSNSRSRSRSPAPAEEINGETAAAAPVDNSDGSQAPADNGAAAGGGGGQQDESKPLEIYIGNLAFSTRDEDIETLFRSEVPDLIEARVVMDRMDPTKSRGFAFAKVNTQEEADKAIAKFNETEVDGRTIRVNMSGQKTERPERKTTTNNGGPGETELYVGSLAWETNDADLETLFGAHGTVLSARVVMDRADATKSRGFAFVKAATLVEAEEMVRQLDGAELQGRNLKVNIAKGKSDRPPRGGGYGGGGY